MFKLKLKVKPCLRRLLYVLAISSMFTSNSANAEWSASDTLTDPTAPFNIVSPAREAIVPNAPAQQYKLSLILVRKDKKIAVLNSQRVSEGDTIGDAIVLNIEKEFVNLSIAGENKTLTLYQNSIKTLSVNENRSLVVINP